MDVGESVRSVVEDVCAGRLLQTIDRWYDEDVVVVESGTPVREGRAVHRARERAFLNGVEFHGAEVGALMIDGEKAVVEWRFDVTPKGGSRQTCRRLSLQTWRDGRIVREDVFR